MAAIYTTYAVQQFLNEMKDGSGTIPTSYFAAAYTVAPIIDGGTGGTELSSAGGGPHSWYARQALAYATPSGRTMANSGIITFTSSSPTAVTGNVVALVIADSGTIGAGNIWIILPLTSPIAVGIGSQLIFPIGQILQEFAGS